MEEVRLYRMDEVCARLRCTRMKIYRLMASGDLTTVRIGRSRLFHSDAVDRLVANGTQDDLKRQ